MEARPRIASFSADPATRILLADVARIADCDHLALSGLDAMTTGSGASEPPTVDALVCDLRSEAEASLDRLEAMLGYCDHIGARLVIVADLDGLDPLEAISPPDRTLFVIGDDPAELLVAMNLAARGRKMGTLFDPNKADGHGELTRISSELAEYARALSRMAAAEATGEVAPDHLADRPLAFRGKDAAPRGPFRADENDPVAAGIDAADVRELIRLRRLRDRYFDAELFADPAWDILLDLFAARLEGTNVSVSSLCIAAAVPATTALRWIRSMTGRGYLERRADPTDARRVYVRLSEETARKMAAYVRLRLGERGI